MKKVELSERMQALADMVPENSVVCDIGCDHGFVSIYLIQQKIASKVYAMDVGQGPLERAGEHIREYHLEAYIETRLSDGLNALQEGEATCMVCAGMGGRLMMRILKEGRRKAHAMQALILQPQSELGLFRAFLRKEGYKVTQENMIYEEGKYYPMMKVVPVAWPQEAGGMQHENGVQEAGYVQPEKMVQDAGAAQDYELWDMFGELLLKEKHPVLKQYLVHSREYLSQLLQQLNVQGGERAKERATQIQEELRMIQKALAYMEWEVFHG